MCQLFFVAPFTSGIIIDVLGFLAQDWWFQIKCSWEPMERKIVGFLINIFEWLWNAELLAFKSMSSDVLHTQGLFYPAAGSQEVGFT